MCQVHNSSFQEKTNSFFLKFDQRIYIFEGKNQFKMFLEMCFVQQANEQCVYLSTNNNSSFCDGKECKVCSPVLNKLFKDQKLTVMLFGGDGTHCFATKTSRNIEKGNASSFLKKFLRQQQSGTQRQEQKKAKIIQFMTKSCRLPIA